MKTGSKKNLAKPTYQQKNRTAKKNTLAFLVRKFGKKIYKKRQQFLIGTLVVLLLLLVFGFFRMLFFLCLLTILNVISSFISRRIPRASTSIELIMFSTILTGFAYGSKVGALFGMFSCVMYYYGTGRFSYFITVFVPLYGIIGAVAPLFSSYGITYVGIFSSLIYTFFAAGLVYILYSAKIDKIILFAVINSFFNILMFTHIAPLLLTLM